ncbi:hypothetical protein TNCV_3209711 [Trichonephila clavipes]|nr:hypothetical protein TNCV_3209711 [Trichonephila clavipes]
MDELMEMNEQGIEELESLGAVQSEYRMTVERVLPRLLQKSIQNPLVKQQNDYTLAFMQICRQRDENHQKVASFNGIDYCSPETTDGSLEIL